ncbi:MAG: hypothetical protein WC878_04455 [Candidatus Paceibacterota bacterium]|jgi:hypothetical protein
MNGTFKTKHGRNPSKGDEVVIFVYEPCKATGVWSGVITDVGGILRSHLPDDNTCDCSAKITDGRVSGTFLYGFEPSTNYEVRYCDEALPILIEAVEEQKREVKGLQKRMKIERDVLYGALKAMVSPELAERFEEAIKLLLQK